MMMKAAVARAFGQPLTIEELPVPQPGPGEVLVKVVACGVCACSGGVFRDAYNVIGGVDRAIPVDVYAPGCAIRPETVIDAIVEACGILDQKEAVMRAGGDPLTVGGAATWDGGVELGEDGFVAAAGVGDAPAGTPAAPAAGDAPAGTPAAAKEAE